MAVKGAGKGNVEGPRGPFFDAIERNGRWVFNCLIKPCTYKTTEPHGMRNHLEMVHKQCLDVQTIIGVLPADERPKIVTPIEQNTETNDFLKLQMLHSEEDKKRLMQLAELVVSLKGQAKCGDQIKFDAILGEDGRLTIPEPTRILHKLKRGYVLTLSIVTIMVREKDAS